VSDSFNGLSYRRPKGSSAVTRYVPFKEGITKFDTEVAVFGHKTASDTKGGLCAWAHKRLTPHLSITETAQVLGLSEANVKTRLCRARLQMRHALAPGFDGAWSRGRTHEKVRPF
jgi:Sigma-70, region 4